LRQYYAGLLIRHGESVKTVEARLGHASASRPSTPTRTCGQIQKTGPATQSTPFSVPRSGRGLGRGLWGPGQRRSDGEPACRRGSVRPEGRGDHPSKRPTWGLPPVRRRADDPCPTFGLAPGGVYRAARVTPGAGALLPHRFTLACADRSPPSAVCSLLHCPSGRPDWPLASTLSYGAPTFLDTVPARRAVPRSPDRLTVVSQCGRSREPRSTPGLGHRPPAR
jgi:hypothetical protein